MDRSATSYGSPRPVPVHVWNLPLVAIARSVVERHPAWVAAILAAALYATLFAPALTGRAVLAPTDILIPSGLIGFRPGQEQAQNDLLFDPVGNR